MKIKEKEISEWVKELGGLSPCIECCFSVGYRRNILCNGHHPDTCLELKKFLGINGDSCGLMPEVKGHYEMQNKGNK